MFFTILTSVLITLWIIFCAMVYGYHYLIEVVLDLPISGQSPCTAHTALKQIIQKLLREALDLPNLTKAEHHPAVPVPDEGSRTYEDLLATAILNKVISNCQNNIPSSSTSVCSRISTPTRRPRDEKEYFFSDETLDDKYRNQDLETTSISSLEEWIQSDSSFGSTKYVDRVSLTIQQRIEEASQSDSEDNDDSDYFQKSSSLLTDDDSNWYLQKRQFDNRSQKGTNSPVPVPMLVPNPTNEAKVLIGDKELDDTSDLSDLASDYGDMEETVPTINNVLIDSKTVIGGKNLIDTIHLSDNESSADSGVREDRGEEDDERFYEQPITDVTVDDENVEDTSLQSIYSNTEKDTEYTEKYATLPKKIPLRINDDETTEKPSTIVTATENNERPILTEKKTNATHFEGYYSKREKEKWKNPVEMKNNPYSKENIEKRIQSSKTFGRDYYKKQASIPSGAKKTDENSSWFSNEHDLYKAVPTIIDDDDELEKHDENVSEFTSDSDLSFVNCYDVEKSQIVRKTSNTSQTEIKVDLKAELSPKEVEYMTFLSDKPVPQKRHKIKTDSTKTPTNSLRKKGQTTSKSTTKSEFSLELSDIEIIPHPKESPEICELKDKRLVSHRLGQFSKSFPNLSEIHANQPIENFLTNNCFVSVKDLRKKFENKDSNHKKDKFVHSLTGRSLSKPIRETLKIQEAFKAKTKDNCAKDNGEDHLLLRIEENTIQSSNC